ncbi:bifunctional DNA-formamidopyrimidine glycosylase/DNA-(apurinic or apyrimidinic site) lyase [Lentibacter sp. XHP0401]|uniref:bifunctional DNA-formamidopyrimidine glycosylase/DNA-(apurinic or apyrimidinic site) lyase n=1 Tax=Lentibacter sp. XHP0401 TaxID=2984334 RepID=UPI0021E7E985|nr:bifunctional DNA-formamidopyrimidine glycosylase/DNA-(apurinic or apyrimidinic site) lyase [Lentibacter sp. XHP0401]MCV2893649.1 bifunctional DNA-formamidopyrimidine glycosylase/DNA-(apurinic or apyrimidinic site) lyase [Lentibacter sp. XHP0401]
MPELPEVETVRCGLSPSMEGVRIERVDVNRPDLRWPFPERMAERLAGQEVLRLRRRSKYILADLSSGESLLIHLGMSGRMTVSGDPLGQFVHEHPQLEKHDHVIIWMEGGARIAFNDPRRFGAMDLLPTQTAESHPLLAKLGPEPLGNAFSESYLAEALAGRRTPMKAALLDQKIIAGLGNIYVCEVLHRTGISPTRLAGKVSRAKLAKVVPAVREVLQNAISAGGSSLKDFKQASGELGYFQHQFHVYDREGAACQTPECGGTIKRIVQSGRSTFYCPRCQR